METTFTTVSAPKSRLVVDARAREFHENGYLVLPKVVDWRRLTELSGELTAAYENADRGGRLVTLGGTKSGHLNCFPGARSRFVYDTLAERGVFDLVRRLSPEPLGMPNVGCNFNLPDSHEQNDHVDGDPARPFFVLNVAAVDTILENGAMEVLVGTHRSTHEYWRVLLCGYERKRVPLRQGDVVIRVSTLWHRGMPNHTSTPRPMLAFTWENGGTTLHDPYTAHGGAITFLPNRYGNDWTSRLREHAFAMSPRAGTAFLALRSLVASARRT
jgi:hypothetical protein